MAKDWGIKKVTPKTNARIIAALRKASYSHPPRNAAKGASRVAPASHICAHCDAVVYEGAKDLSDIRESILSDFDDVIEGKIYMDHKDPVKRPEEAGEESLDWNGVITRMFVEKDGWQALCYECHHIKTFLERELRKQFRELAKNQEKID